jgi:hypothetical protein
MAVVAIAKKEHHFFPRDGGGNRKRRIPLTHTLYCFDTILPLP